MHAQCALYMHGAWVHRKTSRTRWPAGRGGPWARKYQSHNMLHPNTALSGRSTLADLTWYSSTLRPCCSPRPHICTHHALALRLLENASSTDCAQIEEVTRARCSILLAFATKQGMDAFWAARVERQSAAMQAVSERYGRALGIQQP